MPIRPENRDRYPPSWREIGRRIRFERANGACECTGQCGIDHAEESASDDERCDATDGDYHRITGSSVVLTVAHLDHMPENCADDNLLAMCQRCHNRYDAPARRAGRQQRERAQLAIRDLFAA